MRIIVCGGRSYSNKKRLYEVLDILLPIKDQITILQGEAYGADALAKQWCEDRAVSCEDFPADWYKYRHLKKNPSGLLRNRQMFDIGCDLVIAFPGKIGTPDMCAYAKSKDCEVIKIDWD